jgi:hypothetical protein
MPSLCLSCIIYTIKDKQVEENKYVQIFLIWLSQIIKAGGLDKDDILHMYIDKITLTYLFSNSIFGSLLKKAAFATMILGIPPPKTHLEGMMWKYNISDYTQTIYMYLDIDILVIKPLKELIELVVPNSICVCIEGYMSNSDYGADIPSEIEEGMNGFSAGKFMVYGKDLRDCFFKKIQAFCNYDKIYYTVDQPFFNRAILDMENIDVDVLVEPYVSFEYNKKTVLLDCAGEPGNGNVHYTKILDVLCLLNCDAL